VLLVKMRLVVVVREELFKVVVKAQFFKGQQKESSN
jgi:hypothetical protein